MSMVDMKPIPRRVALVDVTLDLLIVCMTEGAGWRRFRCVADGLPADVVVVSVAPDPNRPHVLKVLLSSAQFAPVVGGDMVPVLRVPRIEVHRDE